MVTGSAAVLSVCENPPELPDDPVAADFEAGTIVAGFTNPPVAAGTETAREDGAEDRARWAVFGLILDTAAEGRVG